jgi:hypothetical protein
MGEPSPISDEDFVRMAYQVIMQRRPDDGGVASWTEFLQEGNWRKRLVEAMVGSEEFRTLGTESLRTRLHWCRMTWISSLPTGDDVLDIGGSSPSHPEGAMFQMEWTGRPSTMTIADLPPDEQYHGRPAYSQDEPFVTDWGGRVVYVHSSGEDLVTSGVLDDRTFDGVFMGQVIEHLQIAAVPGVLEWIRDRLRPGGWFAFDTPNRAITELQTPDAFTDADHKWEYRANELVALLTDAGFRVESQAGIMPMPQSLADRVWNAEETYSLPMVTSDPTTGYCLGFVARPA